MNTCMQYKAIFTLLFLVASIRSIGKQRIDSTAIIRIGGIQQFISIKSTEEYYSKLLAPKKKLFWFENSGHPVPTTEPVLFQEVIIKEVLPQTF